MKKKKMTILLVMITVFAVLLSALGTYMFLNPKRTTICVFNDEYKQGDILTADKLQTIQIDSTAVVEGAKINSGKIYMSVEQANKAIEKKDVLRFDVSKDTPLMKSLLASGGGTQIEQSLHQNRIGITVPISNTTGVTSELKKGSIVNVYTTGQDGGTKILFEGIKIINTQKDGDGNIIAATLEVTKKQSIELVDATNYSSIYLGIINNSKYEYNNEQSNSVVDNQQPAEEQPVEDLTQ